MEIDRCGLTTPSCCAPQDTLVAIRVTLPEKDEDTDEPSPAESLQMAVRLPVKMILCGVGGWLHVAGYRLR